MEEVGFSFVVMFLQMVSGGGADPRGNSLCHSPPSLIHHQHVGSIAVAHAYSDS
jgi:hypothetical protein